MKRHLLLAVAAALLAGGAGCSTTSSVPEGVGDLTPVEAASIQSGFTQIGVIHTIDPGAPVFDTPDGVTIGSVEVGDFPVYDARGGWYMTAVDTCDGVVFGWVPPSAVTFTPSDG